MSTNAVDPRQILQALLARRNMMGGMPTPSTGAPSPQGGIPGAVPTPQVQQPQSQPQSQVQAPRQLSPAAPSPFGGGTFGDRRGIISSIVNAAEKRSHDKKVNEAEMYYNQINTFLASGDPQDQEHAQRLLDDPKVRKILKTGLDFVPLEEEVPPEAIGVYRAQQKLNSKNQPQGRAIIPQASQQSQMGIQKLIQDMLTKQAEAGKYKAEEGKAIEEGKKATAEAEAEPVKSEAEKARWEAEKVKANKELEEAEEKIRQSKEESPFKIQELQANTNLKKAQSFEANARGRYWQMGGKLPGSQIQSGLKSSRADLVSMWKDANSTNNKIKDEMRKQSGVSAYLAKSGVVADASSGSYMAETRVKKLTDALKWYDTEGSQQVIDGKMSITQMVAETYKRAGMEPAPDGIAGPQPYDNGPIVVTPEDMK